MHDFYKIIRLNERFQTRFELGTYISNSLALRLRKFFLGLWIGGNRVLASYLLCFAVRGLLRSLTFLSPSDGSLRTPGTGGSFFFLMRVSVFLNVLQQLLILSWLMKELQNLPFQCFGCPYLWVDSVWNLLMFLLIVRFLAIKSPQMMAEFTFLVLLQSNLSKDPYKCRSLKSLLFNRVVVSMNFLFSFQCFFFSLFIAFNSSMGFFESFYLRLGVARLLIERDFFLFVEVKRIQFPLFLGNGEEA